VGGLQDHFMQTLSAAGFLEDETFASMEQERRREFAENPVREPAHAGSAYPAAPEQLRVTMERYLDGADGAGPAPQNLFALAAPHVSPEGGWQSYRAAYRLLRPEHRQRTFVILATSHYGEPNKFGLTRKKFVTPLGEVETDERLVTWLAEHGGDAVQMEDYCHSFEHSIELQLIFLQHQLGTDVRIVPVLCGSFARSLYQGGQPEDDDAVRRFFDVLGELGERESSRLFWLLGVDMAHMGVRYHDEFSAVAERGRMLEVAARDRRRIDAINSSDALAFWELVRENRDELKWCGASPFYTFLKTFPGASGELLRYEQWNIDEHSVVSFAGMAFSRE